MSKAKRVLVIIHTPTFGGPHNQVLRMHTMLREHGWDQLVLLPTEPGNAYERLSSAGINVIRMPLHRLRATPDLRQQWQLIAQFRAEVDAIREVIVAEGVDLVQVCGLLNIHGARAARQTGRPLVWQLLSTFAPYPLRLIVTPLVTRWADVIMSTGWTVAKQHPGALRAKERIISFFPPVDVSNFQPDPEKRKRARLELGVPDHVVLMGTIGNFSRQKGHDLLIEVAAAMRQQRPETAFRVLGTETYANADYYRNHVRKPAMALGLHEGNYLEFVDPGQRVPELIQAFDIFLLTSRSEGIPTVGLEAMASGIPVVSTNVGSVGEMVQNGENGILLQSNDADSIVKELLPLVDNMDCRMKMGRNARLRAESEFDTKVCTEMHIKAYHQAIMASYTL